MNNSLNVKKYLLLAIFCILKIHETLSWILKSIEFINLYKIKFEKQQTVKRKFHNVITFWLMLVNHVKGIQKYIICTMYSVAA